MWPPLATWLKTIEKPPSVQACQQHLSTFEALLQPFFDPARQRLRVLWLDKDHLRVRDLPDDCAEQHLWLEKEADGVIPQWMRGFEAIRMGVRGESPGTDWQNVLTSVPVTVFADTLSAWATAQQLEQLTVIFPAPLGQLPWEALPQLEMLLVREVSVGHWLKTKSPEASMPATETWVVSDPSGEAECMVKEGRWVANHFHTIAQNPCPSVFDALQHLAHSRHAHFATHGQFNRYEPTASHLTLNQNKGVRFPLWMTGAVRTSADLVMLSACESNVSGQETEGLLTPIGIGPSLAAAGAKTVVGTLWSYDGVAALCFSYYFYQIAEQNPSLHWHHVAARARQAVRKMTGDDLETLAEQLDLYDKKDRCRFSVESHAYSEEACPFGNELFLAWFIFLSDTIAKKAIASRL